MKDKLRAASQAFSRWRRLKAQQRAERRQEAHDEARKRWRNKAALKRERELLAWIDELRDELAKANERVDAAEKETNILRSDIELLKLEREQLLLINERNNQRIKGEGDRWYKLPGYQSDQ